MSGIARLISEIRCEPSRRISSRITPTLHRGAGVLGYVDLFATLEAPVTSMIIRSFSEGDLVVMQREVDFFGPKVFFDVLRFEDGQLAEHWDTMQEVPAEFSHDNGMF